MHLQALVQSSLATGHINKAYHFSCPVCLLLQDLWSQWCSVQAAPTFTIDWTTFALATTKAVQAPIMLCVFAAAQTLGPAVICIGWTHFGHCP